jgi:hypothetical protein
MGVVKRDITTSAPQYRVIRKASRSLYKGNQVAEVAMATFNPSANTGERTVAAHGLGVFIPAKAVITRVLVDVVTTFTSAGADAGTIALHVQNANDITAAIAISDASNVWDAGVHGTIVGMPALDGNARSAIAGGAAEAGAMIKTTAEREITATVATQALTAGKCNVYVEYFISD